MGFAQALRKGEGKNEMNKERLSVTLIICQRIRKTCFKNFLFTHSLHQSGASMRAEEIGGLFVYIVPPRARVREKFQKKKIVQIVFKSYENLDGIFFLLTPCVSFLNVTSFFNTGMAVSDFY